MHFGTSRMVFSSLLDQLRTCRLKSGQTENGVKNVEGDDRLILRYHVSSIVHFHVGQVSLSMPNTVSLSAGSQRGAGGGLKTLESTPGQVLNSNPITIIEQNSVAQSVPQVDRYL